jgi:hypothetical protein
VNTRQKKITTDIFEPQSKEYTVPKAQEEVCNILTCGLGANPYITKYFGSYELFQTIIYALEIFRPVLRTIFLFTYILFATIS